MKKIIFLIFLFLFSGSANALCLSSTPQTINYLWVGYWDCEFTCQQLLITGGQCTALSGSGETLTVNQGNLTVHRNIGGGYPPVVKGSYTLNNGTVMVINGLAANTNNLWTGCMLSQSGREVPCRVR